MFESIVKRCDALAAHFNEIGGDRTLILQKIAAYIQHKIDHQQTARLVYICTHNSRRSHLAQVWAAVAATYYGLPNIQTYSGGTEVTAFNANAIKALTGAGFNIQKSSEVQNPIYKVYFGEEAFSTCYSKVHNDVANPQQGFAAIMTCSDAADNCPFIPACELRIGTTYQDPKAFDGSVLQLEKYQERSNQIAMECLYVFSLIRKA